MRKPKRDDLVRQVMQETGLTGDKKTPTYFTRSQLLDLLVIFRAYKTQIETLTEKVKKLQIHIESTDLGEIDNDGIEKASSN